jgi:hypothetical protein
VGQFSIQFFGIHQGENAREGTANEGMFDPIYGIEEFEGNEKCRRIEEFGIQQKYEKFTVESFGWRR